METILVAINHNLVFEKEYLLAVRRTPPAKALAVERHKLLANIRQVTATQNLPLIISVEKHIVEYDLAHHANSPAMVAAQKRYIAQQCQTLGIAPPDDKTDEI